MRGCCACLPITSTCCPSHSWVPSQIAIEGKTPGQMSSDEFDYFGGTNNVVKLESQLRTMEMRLKKAEGELRRSDAEGSERKASEEVFP